MTMMANDQGRAELIAMARHNIDLVKKGAIEQTPDVLRVPAKHYYDPDRWQLEMAKVFKRLPLMLAMSCELKVAGDFKSTEVAGVPVLIVQAANDPLISAQDQADFTARTSNPNVAALILPGGGHIGFAAYCRAYYFSLIFNFFDAQSGPRAVALE